jgi:hypothetical protein
MACAKRGCPSRSEGLCVTSADGESPFKMTEIAAYALSLPVLASR